MVKKGQTVFDPSNPEHVAQAERDQKLEGDQLRSDFSALLELPAGQRVLWWILSRAGLFRGSFTGNSQTFYNEGRREFGLELLHQIEESDSNALVTLMTLNSETKHG